MRMRLFVVIGLALLAALTLAPAARADLDQVGQAMGVARVDSVQFSGTGFAYAVGQAYQPGQAWPKLNLPRFTRIDDYVRAAHSFDFALSRAEVRGGGAIPQIGEVRRTGGVTGEQAGTSSTLRAPRPRRRRPPTSTTSGRAPTASSRPPWPTGWR